MQKRLEKEPTWRKMAVRSGSASAGVPDDFGAFPEEGKSPFFLPVMGRTAAFPNFPVSSLSARPARAQLPTVGRPPDIARLPAIRTARNR